MHGDSNYPFHKEQSSRDVGLPDGCDDRTYLDTLQVHLDPVLDLAEADLVFYLAGADPYHDDRLGRLCLSADGLRSRDQHVFDTCHARGLPLVLTLAGGYARDLADVATIHGNTVESLLATWAAPTAPERIRA
jgi:acetoin utilization deacetylase AcuC-like enzyme